MSDMLVQLPSGA